MTTLLPCQTTELSDEIDPCEKSRLKASSAAVYKLTETGRLEAKAFPTRPESLHILGSNKRPATPFSRSHLPESPSALFAELNRRIFAQPEGPCFAAGRLELLYASNSEEQLTTRDVAHLASCKACLERANRLLRLLGLPLHFSDDFNDPSDGKPQKPSSGSKQEPLTRMRKKARDIHFRESRRIAIARLGPGLVASTTWHRNRQLGN